MDIIAISYQNIGPFENQLVSLNFKKGAYLIKAPIGTGKSFLFFDGPLFALYKSSSRPMVSRQCEKGYIRCVFEVDNQYWYIERNLSTTKAGNDSTQSSLYSLGGVESAIASLEKSEESLIWDRDICKQFLPFATQIDFANQRDLDASMQQLLPPKELVTTIHLMMQESDHIFELPPQQRILVFKHLFGLLGIDEAKGIIQDRRKVLAGMKAALDDDSAVNTEFKKLLKNIESYKQGFENIVLPSEIENNRALILSQGLLHDIAILIDSVTLVGLTVGSEVYDAISQGEHSIQQLLLQNAKNQGIIEQHREQGTTLSKKIQTVSASITNQKLQLDRLDKEILSLSDLGIEQLEQEKLQLQTDYDEIQSSFDSDLFSQLSPTVKTLQQGVDQISTRLHEGIHIASTITLKEQSKLQISEKIDADTKRLDDLKTQITLLRSDHKKQTTFTCDKIKSECPYVDLIRGVAGKKIHDQVEYLSKQASELEKLLQSSQRLEQIQALDKEIISLNQKKSQLGQFLKSVSWKEVQSLGEKQQHIQKSMLILQEKFKRIESQSNRLKNSKEEKLLLINEIDILTRTLEELSSQEVVAKATLENLEKQYLLYDDSVLHEYRGLLQQLRIVYQKIDALISQYTQNQKKKHDVQMQLKITKNLYQIFSKELLVVVLQDFLPQLQDVINAYLSQVVTYEIAFIMPDDLEEGVELEVEIVDELGVRPVKSLSGGQRAILKICRILAISSLLNSKFLFLDETITSLDSEAVADVAEMIDQFVKSKNIKVYIVTHAPQIQSMTIWDKQIVIDNNRSKSE